MKSPEVNWRDWVSKAEHDLLNIRNNVAADEVPWDTVCFHAQQAAEKLLKGLLVFHGVQPARTHDLVALLHECAAHEQGLTSLMEDCRLLTVLGVRARYPDERMEPSREDGQAALGALERIRRTVQRCLPEQGEPAQEGGRG